MTPKQHEAMLEFCRLAGSWYVNNQNTEETPWGGVIHSADIGRFIYQYNVVPQTRGGNGVWGQGVGIMGLLALAKRLDWAGDDYKKAALAAGKYLMTLQILDQRDERTFGAMREATPQWPWIYPRDGATGCMGLCVLYKETKEEEYLYRARLWADWFIKIAMGDKIWPAYSYDLEKREGSWHGEGFWQVGAGLQFYYLYKLTGEKRYLTEGLTPLMEGCKKFFAAAKGEAVETGAQHDFAAIATMGACLLKKDAKLIAYVQDYATRMMKKQEEDGSCPGMAGTYEAGLTWLNFIQLVKKLKLRVNTAPFQKAIDKALAFAPSCQERNPQDPRAFGGLYGQSQYEISRTVIHHRSTGYALLFMLRGEGGVTPAGYDIFDW